MKSKANYKYKPAKRAALIAASVGFGALALLPEIVSGAACVTGATTFGLYLSKREQCNKYTEALKEIRIDPGFYAYQKEMQNSIDKIKENVTSEEALEKLDQELQYYSSDDFAIDYAKNNQLPQYQTIIDTSADYKYSKQLAKAFKISAIVSCSANIVGVAAMYIDGKNKKSITEALLDKSHDIMEEANSRYEVDEPIKYIRAGDPDPTCYPEDQSYCDDEWGANL